ncbi:MAG: (Fe-S)-binding protein [Deinococcales bacterium]
MRVALFATCIADQIFPHVAVSTVKLLRHLGVKVEFPEAQSCCGQPAYNAGYHQESREIALHHIKLFTGYDYVILPSGSCGAMVKHYPDLFVEQPENYAKARHLAERTFEVTTFIHQVLGREDIGADLEGLNITYHDSCHALRLMHVSEAPRALLKAAGANILEAEGHDTCCGFGGLFSVKMAEISSAMAKAKFQGIKDSKAQILSSTDAGCLMQLEGSLRRSGEKIEVRHVVDLLWQGVEAKSQMQEV